MKVQCVETDPVVFISRSDDHLHLPFALARLLGYAPVHNSPLETPLNFNGTLFEAQEGIFEEAQRYLEDDGSTLLHLYPGFGKTTLAVYLACNLSRFTVVLVTRETFLKQWKNTFHRWTDAMPFEAGDKLPNERPPIIICMIGRIDHLPEEWLQGITLIIDELHMYLTQPRLASILTIKPNKVIGLTATPKTGGLRGAMHALVGREQIWVKFGEYPQFRVQRIFTSLFPTEEKGTNGVKWDIYMKSIIHNHRRNLMICMFAAYHVSQGHKVLIHSASVDHVVKLEKLLEVICDYKISSLYGSKNSYEDPDIFLGTLSKTGTGFDEESFCVDFQGKKIDVVIEASPFRDPELLEQSIGRSFRSENPLIIDIQDRGRVASSQGRDRVTFYESKGAIIESFSEDPEMLDVYESMYSDTG